MGAFLVSTYCIGIRTRKGGSAQRALPGGAPQGAEPSSVAEGNAANPSWRTRA